MEQFTGKRIAQIARETYGTSRVTPEQLAHVTDMLTPSSYLLRNHTIKNHPITFHISDRNSLKVFAHRPWQIEIINDTHRNKAIIKSRQLGLSEMGVGSMLHFADTHSYAAVKCLYTFPTNKQMKDFVQTRLDPVIEKGYYNTIVDKDTNSLQVKRIRNSFLYFRSSSTPGALEGVDIDYLSLDEYDRVPSLAEASALESLSSSNFKITNRWSTPSVPDMGIHALFTESDQNWYLHKCNRCNHYNQMSYNDYDENAPIEKRGNILCVNPKGVDVLARTVVEGSFQFVCQKCGEPLDRWYNGSWVAKYPDRTLNGAGTRGYMISQLNAVWMSADALKEKELKSKSKQAFYNYTLGYPYADVKLMVTKEDILKHRVPSRLMEAQKARGKYKLISVGIDWGNHHWVTIHGMTSDGKMDLIRLFNVDKTKATDFSNIGADLDKIKLELAPYNPDIIVADIGDSGDKLSQLISYYGKDRVFGCKYPSTPKSTGNIIPSWSEGNNIVSVDKLMQNKRYITKIKEGEIGFYANYDRDLAMFAEHWGNVVIRDEEDTDGSFYQTITRKGDDHYSQASVYSMLGIERLREVMYGENSYGFDSTFVGGTQTDILTQFG